MNNISHKIILVVLAIIIILIILIIIIILKNYKMSKYLNYNSTFMGGNSKYNPSDIYYSENIELLTTENYIKNYLKEYVNAPDDAIIIYNSGASESIANMMFWAKSISRFGTVLGSVLDHPSVKANAENYDLNYKQLNYDELIKAENSEAIDIPDGVNMIFITGICPSTGEYYPMNFKKYDYLLEGGDNIDSEQVRQLRPLKVLDATQLIGKSKIDMVEQDLNAVFFSLHKIGGEFNTGILIVREPKGTFRKEFREFSDSERVKEFKFKPLISGSQQDHMRGGTYNAYAYQNIPNLLKNYESNYKPDECEDVYNQLIETLKDNNINYYEPKLKHTYNTVLIKLKGCNAKAIHALSEYGIYVGSATACQSDNISKELRISYLNKDEFGRNTIKRICQVIKDVDESQDEDKAEGSEEIQIDEDLYV